MTKEQAITKWTQAATVSAQGIRLDNWRPLAHVLRHCTVSDKIEETSPGILTVTRTTGEGDKAKTTTFSVVVA